MSTRKERRLRTCMFKTGVKKTIVIDTESLEEG